jgi:hypothetical protein
MPYLVTNVDKITRYIGETIKLEATVVDENGDPAVLTDAHANFAWTDPSGTTTKYNATVADGKVSYTIPHSETLIRGTYFFEFAVELLSEVGGSVIGEIELLPRKITEVTIVV